MTKEEFLTKTELKEDRQKLKEDFKIEREKLNEQHRNEIAELRSIIIEAPKATTGVSIEVFNEAVSSLKEEMKKIRGSEEMRQSYKKEEATAVEIFTPGGKKSKSKKKIYYQLTVMILFFIITVSCGIFEQFTKDNEDEITNHYEQELKVALKRIASGDFH